MGDWTPLILPLTIAIFAIGFIALLTPRLMGSNKNQDIDMTCPICQHRIKSRVRELAALTPAESGFVVREAPGAYGRPLGELQCAKCKSVHVFAIDSFPPQFIVTNSIGPTARKNSCVQCRTMLRPPAWPKGMYDGKIYNAPGVEGKHGLVCRHCGSIVCVQCCQEASRGRTAANVLRCPRCARSPIDMFHHFT